MSTSTTSSFNLLQSPRTLETKHILIDEDDVSILDDKILSPTLSPTNNFSDSLLWPDFALHRHDHHPPVMFTNPFALAGDDPTTLDPSPSSKEQQEDFPFGGIYDCQSSVMSPRSSQQSHHGGWIPAPTDMPDSSPTPSSVSPVSIRRETLRECIRNGIRKKNARFDIPIERTLANIDELISQATDDVEVKELKQQKRLLRNRQAA